MKRPLDLLDQISDVVERQTRAQAAQIMRCNAERMPMRSGTLADKAAPQRFVDHLTKRFGRTAHFRLELRRNVLIERQCRPHALMLLAKHHDVNRFLFRGQSKNRQSGSEQTRASHHRQSL